MSQSISFWSSIYKLPSFPSLNRSIETDVCIVGAGIVGITCAYLLSGKGLNVVVIDSESIGGNQTSRTTAHLANALDDHYFDLEKYFGRKGSKIAAESHAAAIDLIESIVKKENISCFFERLNAYLFAPPGESKDIIEKEYKAAKRAGLNVSLQPCATLSVDTGKCLKYENQAQFDPLRYIDGLIKAVQKNGGEFFSHTHATSIKDGNVTLVKTNTGFTIRAAATIVATNTPINDRVIMHTKQASYRTYVIAGKIEKDSVEKGLYYDTFDPYHYVRLAYHPEKNEDVLIVGGEDHRTGENPHPEIAYDLLEAWTKEYFPSFKKVEYKWSGQVLEPVDSLGFLGKNPLNKNIYIATGDSGNGMTHGTLGAILITDLILKEKQYPDWEKLYRPKRKNIKAALEYTEENLNTFIQYLDWFTPGSHEKLKPNCGIVLRDGLSKIACYCDEKNQIHEFSAICPHLAGIVRWNEAEKTWDCPCHGSRFTALGKVINGPSNSNLKPRKGNSNDKKST